MHFSKNTSTGISKGSIIKITVVLLGKIDFPSPNKKIEKTISNEKLKIVK